MAGMRVLLISPVFPPLLDSEAICGGKMALALKAAGVDVTVLSDPFYLARRSAREDRSGLWQELWGTAEAVPAAGPPRGTGAAWWGLRYGAVGISPQWVRAVVRRARRLHAQRPFDVVYSRSLPVSAHIAGYWTARALRRPWLANTDDPWDYHYTPAGGRLWVPKTRRYLSAYWLRQTLSRADALTFPCRRLGAFVMRAAGIEREIQVIAHIGRASPKAPTAGPFRLVHAGKIGASGVTKRSTAGLLAGLAKLAAQTPRARKEAQVVLVGREDGATRNLAEQLGVSAMVLAKGPVSYEESLDVIAEASACLLVEARMREGLFLPSKFADYVAARKPVLALSPPAGTIADFLPDSGILRVDPEDAAGIAAALRVLFDDWCAGRLARRAPSERLVRMFSPAAAARRWLTAAEAVVARGGTRGRRKPLIGLRAAWMALGTRHEPRGGDWTQLLRPHPIV